MGSDWAWLLFNAGIFSISFSKLLDSRLFPSLNCLALDYFLHLTVWLFFNSRVTNFCISSFYQTPLSSFKLIFSGIFQQTHDSKNSFNSLPWIVLGGVSLDARWMRICFSNVMGWCSHWTCWLQPRTLRFDVNRWLVFWIFWRIQSREQAFWNGAALMAPPTSCLF